MIKLCCEKLLFKVLNFMPQIWLIQSEKICLKLYIRYIYIQYIYWTLIIYFKCLYKINESLKLTTFLSNSTNITQYYREKSPLTNPCTWCSDLSFLFPYFVILFPDPIFQSGVYLILVWLLIQILYELWLQPLNLWTKFFYKCQLYE